MSARIGRAAHVVDIVDLRVELSGRTVFSDVSFSVGADEIVSIVGPSGVGKTTLLKVLAGFLQPASGAVRFARPPDRDRPVIMVFQDYVLFPNLSVFENVAFGLRARRMRGRHMRQRVDEMLAHFGLAEFAARYPNQLSAGQQQRVAIARAMIVEPTLLLLDEPFANLDRNLKMSTAEFIRTTQKNFGVATVSVTHDLEEAFVMSDRVGIMLDGIPDIKPDIGPDIDPRVRSKGPGNTGRNGLPDNGPDNGSPSVGKGARLVQFDAPGQVYENPASLAAARFLGPVNVFDRGLLAAMGAPEPDIARLSDGCSAFARPEAMAVEPDPAGPGVVEMVSFAGHYVKYIIQIEDKKIIVYGLRGSLAPGQRVRVRVERFFTTSATSKDCNEQEAS